MEPNAPVRLMARCLERAAELDEKEPEGVGPEFDIVDAAVPRRDPSLAVAVAFWDAWNDERKHRFPGNFEGIVRADWPGLARMIATALVTGRPIDEPRIQKNFVLRRCSV
jgi:hypothetical protein